GVFPSVWTRVRAYRQRLGLAGRRQYVAGWFRSRRQRSAGTDDAPYRGQAVGGTGLAGGLPEARGWVHPDDRGTRPRGASSSPIPEIQLRTESKLMAVCLFGQRVTGRELDR